MKHVTYYKPVNQINKKDSLPLVFKESINMVERKAPLNISLEYPWQKPL